MGVLGHDTSSCKEREQPGTERSRLASFKDGSCAPTADNAGDAGLVQCQTLGPIVFIGIALFGLLSFGASSLPITLTSILPLSRGSRREDTITRHDKCDDILLGAWIETCFVVSDEENVFPGMQGVLSYPIFVTRSDDGNAGVSLHGYSLSEPFFGGEDYLEIGRGEPSRVEAATPTRNCVATFSSRLKVSSSLKWDTDRADYYWNQISSDTLVAGNGKNAACQFRRMYGNECREARLMAIKKFKEVGISIDLPSIGELCG